LALPPHYSPAVSRSDSSPDNGHYRAGNCWQFTPIKGKNPTEDTSSAIRVVR
jgi:hypothetical protein